MNHASRISVVMRWKLSFSTVKGQSITALADQFFYRNNIKPLICYSTGTCTIYNAKLLCLSFESFIPLCEDFNVKCHIEPNFICVHRKKSRYLSPGLNSNFVEYTGTIYISYDFSFLSYNLWKIMPTLQDWKYKILIISKVLPNVQNSSWCSGSISRQ